MSWASTDPHTRELAETILTTRQLAIVQDRANGHSWRTIADAYSIDEATARGHHKRAIRRIQRARKEAA